MPTTSTNEWGDVVAEESPTDWGDQPVEVPPIDKAARLRAELEAARNELSPYTEIMSQRSLLPPLLLPPEDPRSLQNVTQNLARNFQGTLPDWMQADPARYPAMRLAPDAATAVSAGGESLAHAVESAAAPENLPLLPLAFVPGGAPAMGLYFGSHALNDAASQFGEASVTHDPATVGRGLASTLLGGAMAIPAARGEPFLPERYGGGLRPIEQLTPETPDAIYRETEGPVRPVQQSVRAATREGEVSAPARGAQAGPRGSEPARETPDALQEAVTPEVTKALAEDIAAEQALDARFAQLRAEGRLMNADKSAYSTEAVDLQREREAIKNRWNGEHPRTLSPEQATELYARQNTPADDWLVRVSPSRGEGDPGHVQIVNPHDKSETGGLIRPMPGAPDFLPLGTFRGTYAEAVAKLAESAPEPALSGSIGPGEHSDLQSRISFVETEIMKRGKPLELLGIQHEASRRKLSDEQYATLLENWYRDKEGDAGTESGPASISIGPGAASPAELAARRVRERAARVGEPPAVPPVAEAATPGEPGPQRIVDAPKRPDVMPARDVVASPEFEFRKDPLAGPYVSRVNEAELGYTARVGRTITSLVKGAWGKLPEKAQIAVTKAMRAIQQGDLDALDALTPAERTVADATRAYFDQTREKIIADKQARLVESLPAARSRAVQAILDGTPMATAIRDNRLRGPGRQAVLDALAELHEMRQWGLDNYVTNIEKGTYRVVDEAGVTRAVGETRAEAAAKAATYLKEHPGVRELTLDDSFGSGSQTPTQMSRGQYHRLIAQLAKTLDSDARSIQQQLQREGHVVTIKPTLKYAAPLQRRRGILKGEENLVDALPAYIYSVEKKLALDPLLREARTLLPKLAPNTRTQVEALLNDVRGSKGIADKIVDHVLAPLGQKPFALSRTVNTLRNLSTQLKLGYRPVAALVNRLGGLQHTWTKAGTSAWLAGRKLMRSPEWKALWERNKDAVGAESLAITADGAHLESGTKPWSPLAMFQWAERANRPEAFAAFHEYARTRLGLSGEAAEAYARNLTRFTQFTYNTASLPRAMRGPVGRLLLQFKPYLVKEMEFLRTVATNPTELARYTTGFLALGGPRAAIYLLRSLPFFGALWLFREAEDQLNHRAPATSRGVPGVTAGVDITAAATPQLPSRPEDWLGPVVSDLWKLQRDVIAPAMQGEKRDASDVVDWASRIAPAAFYWRQLVDSATKPEGWTSDDRGRPRYQPTSADRAKLALGAKPLAQSVAEVEARYLRETEAIQRANRARTIDTYLDAVEKGDGAALQRAGEAAMQMGVTRDMVLNAARQRARTPRERLYRSLSVFSRAREADRFAEPPPE
jgi:hypothetical protein